MLESIKTFLIYCLFQFLSKTRIGKIHLLKYIYYKVAMALLMRRDQYAWNEQCARDKGVKIGKNTRIFGGVDFSVEPYLIEIGDDCIIAGGVNFITHDAGVLLFNDGKGDVLGNFGKIKIGNNCYLGANATILPDVQIGDNCLISAGAVVANSFPPNCLIIGNPAKVAANIEFYRKAKMVSKNTVRHDEFGYPNELKIPKTLKKKLLLEHFKNLPIRKARAQNR